MESIYTKKNCEECSKLLEGIYYYCRNCEKFLCYNCIDRHNEHDIVALKFIESGKAKLLPISYFGGGPTGYEWTTYPKDEFLEQLNPCSHALNYLNSNKVVFKNESTKELLCPECVVKDKKNLDYVLLPFVLLNDNETIRMVHIQFYPGVKLKITQAGPITSYKGQNITINVKINNISNYSIKNIEVNLINFSKQKNINPELYSKDWYIECHYPKYFLIDKKTKITKIESNETKEISFDIRIPKDDEVKLPINNPFTVYTAIFYKTLLGDCNTIYANDLNIKLLN